MNKSIVIPALLTASIAFISPTSTYAGDTENIDRCVSAVANGPQKNGLKIWGNGFNCKPWKVSRSGNNIYIKGQISHQRTWSTDDQYNYSFRIHENIEQTKDSLKYSINGGGIGIAIFPLPLKADSWKSTLRNLVVPRIILEAQNIYIGKSTLFGGHRIHYSGLDRHISNEINNENAAWVSRIGLDPRNDGSLTTDMHQTVLINSKDDKLKRAVANRQSSGIKQISFTHQGGWIILYGKDGYQYNNIPKELVSKLQSVTRGRRHELKNVAFTRNGGWSLIWGRNGFYNRNVPQDAHDKMFEFYRLNRELKSIAFRDNGGWSLLWGKNGYYNKGMPKGCHAAIVNLSNQGFILKDVQFIGTNGWAVIGSR